MAANSNDLLKMATDKKALKAMAANSAANETVLLSVKVLKINRKGKAQNRALLVTSRKIFNLMPDNFSKCNRCIELRQLHHISISPSAQEFALHVTHEYDYRFKTGLLDQIVRVLQEAFLNATGDPLEVVQTDVQDLAKSMMTKASVKQSGESWTARPGDSTKADDDAADSEDDEGPTTPRDNGSKSDGSGALAGGAFQAKSRYCYEDFTVLKVLGKGAFGKVMLVRANDNKKIYAMKALSKKVLIERNEIVHTKTERRALSDTHHPFLVHLRFAFQSPSKLYLVMDYCNGGELFFHLKEAGRFDEPRARLYGGEIASAIHHLHTLKIVYRDLKPENVLLDHEGHVRITDFGLAKDAMELEDKTHTFCGTPDYLAPEIIKQSGHGRSVDWWSLGTMIYEMLGGLPPFYSQTLKVMYDRILKAPLEFRPEHLFSNDARHLITGMLQKEPHKRLGSSDRDGLEIREHPWFATIDWKLLEARALQPPFIPKVLDEADVSNFDAEFTTEAIPVGPDNDAPTNSKFDGFTYVDTNHLAAVDLQ